jgi:hypothetical protein
VNGSENELMSLLLLLLLLQMDFFHFYFIEVHLPYPFRERLNMCWNSFCVHLRFQGNGE